MKGSLIIVAFFVAGVILARWGVLPQELLQQDFSMYVLYGLMFLVGISIGSDRKAWAALKGQQLRIVLVSSYGLYWCLWRRLSARWQEV